MSKLTEIFRSKALDVARVKEEVPQSELRRMIRDASPVRPFRAALEACAAPPALIAEVKKASPSKGVIRERFEASEIASAYREAGAHCLSVLTEEKYFLGCRAHFEEARAASGLPCLRKDFLFDPYQVYESRAWGADCILLIVAALPEDVLGELFALARELGMDVLVEVHSRREVESAFGLGADLIGVNNRDLADMSTSLATSDQLLPMAAARSLAVSESALESPGDIDRVRMAGARAVLIGTTFCAAADPGAKVREVMGW